VFSVLILCQSHSNFIIDDAFITFRYSHNLASGNGLVWNLDGAPTQGYTNFLFMLIVAIGIKLSVPPLIMAKGLNYFGLFLIAFSSFFILRKATHSLLLRIILIITISLYPTTIQNINSGLETVFWTGLLLICLYLINVQFSKLRYCLFIVLITAATLTRPETLLFAFIWFIILIFRKQNLKNIIIGIFTSSLAILSYWTFNLLYFGSILPNSAFIKIVNPLSLPGIYYLTLSFQQNTPLSIVTILTICFVFIFQKRNKSQYLSYLPFFIIIPFYVLTDPLMGMYSRFYYPVLMGMVVFAFSGMLNVINSIRQINISQEENKKTIRILSFLKNIMIPIILFCPVVILLLSGITAFIEDLKQPYAQPLLDREIQIGNALGRSPFVDNIYFAYGDAGSIPYYSGVKFLDMVGINDNRIARSGKIEGAEWILLYVMDEEPDVIGFYTTTDGKIYNSGHGIIGTHYSELYSLMMENNNYIYIGGFECGWININFFARRNSQYFSDIAHLFGNMEGVRFFSIVP